MLIATDDPLKAMRSEGINNLVESDIESRVFSHLLVKINVFLALFLPVL